MIFVAAKRENGIEAVKHVLVEFKELSGFGKHILEVLKFKEGHLPMKFLGGAIDFRLQLIKVVLYGIQVYWASVFILPKKVVKLVEQKFNSYLWSGVSGSRVPAKVAWADLTIRKMEGGLDLSDVSDWNKAAVMRFIWNLFAKADSIWLLGFMLRWKRSFCMGCVIYDAASVKQASCQFTCKDSWQVIRDRKAEVIWWKLVLFPKLVPKHAFVSWLAVSHKLTTRDRLASWGYPRNILFKELKGRKWQHVIRKVALAAVIYCIWIDQNAQIRGGKVRSDVESAEAVM
uniref:Reverse transcriptase zinc-binding domain-containing protein n=1 Tax=Fagus sylvatica TaxID=28930 RepID=A0A2N9GQ79_FAGSY